MRHDLNPPEVFYVGKGKNDRAWSSKQRSRFWHSITSKAPWSVCFHAIGLTEDEAVILERELIDLFGRRDVGLGPLVNHTNGGEGISGLVFTDEHRRKLSESNANKGKPLSDLVRRRMSKSKIGHEVSDQTRDKLSKALKGQKRSQEIGEKISKGLRGRKLSKLHRERVSASLKGKKLSEEHKAKLRAAWANKRSN